MAGDGKKSRKIFRNVLIVLAIMLSCVFVGLWIPASMAPEEFKPVVDLTPVQKEVLSKKFVQEVILDFRNITQRGEPFVWSISETEINEYLASIDEIAFLRMGKKRGELDAAMQKAGLSHPVVDLFDGGFMLMIEASKVSKVLSARVEVQSLNGGKIKSEITDTRIGKLPVAKGILVGRLEKLYQRLSAKNIKDEYANSWVKILGALAGGETICPEDVWTINSIRVAIDKIEITNDSMTLFVRPIRPVR